MCQQISEPLLEYCETSVLWKGGIGDECICQTDYCNNSGKYSKYRFDFPSIIAAFVSTILSAALEKPLFLLRPLTSIVKGIGVTTTSPKTPASSSLSINFPLFISDT
ncbi:hypothetical protein WUBG_18771 [Wuchereria bancrofti]|uniref:Uncharacterized protein n=1 Tax=Wuchereria bancrofti TaxID=6293 RepID=J9E087_WUCBA|nr:hypothetical protein WUBG_18771 [Wuchereria bancrofti]